MQNSGLKTPDHTESDAAETPAWVVIQKKSFTKLLNRYIKDPQGQIVDLGEDFKDGRKLLKLLSYVLATDVPNPERGNMRVHHVNNVTKALTFMKSKGVKIVDVGAEEIVDGNLKMTLGMTWAIILHGLIEQIQEGSASAKDGLLLWCQRVTAPYNVKIKDFTKSWRNGLGFCALIHAHRRNLLDYNSMSEAQPAVNLETAFEVAANHLEIPRILDVQDILETPVPDEKSVMAYVAMYYHVFSKSQGVEQAARKLLKILDMNVENTNMIDKYESGTSDLLKWMNEKIPWMQDRGSELQTIDDIRERYAEFQKYRQQEKPPHADEKSQLKSDYQTIQTRLKIQRRPQYIPPEGLNPSILDDVWKTLEREENELLKWLEARLEALKKLEYLLSRFHYKCSMQEEWTAEKQCEVDDSKIDIDSGLSELHGRDKRFITFKEENKSRGNRIGHITQLRNQLREYGYCKMDEVENRYGNLIQEWEALGSKSNQYGEKLQETIRIAKELDELRAEFANGAVAIRNWIDETLEDVGEDYRPRTLPEVDEWEQNTEMFTKSLPDSLKDLQKLKEIEERCHAVSTQPNPYCAITAEQLDAKMKNIDQALITRKKSLESTREELKKHEALRSEFDGKVNEMEAWRKEISDTVTGITIQTSDSLETRITTLKELLVKIECYVQSKLPTIDQLNERMKQMNVYHWESSADADMNVRAAFSGLIRGINAMISELENQITILRSSDLSEKEVKDIKNAFNHFAKDDPNHLNHREFLNCLISLGFNFKLDGENDEKFKQVVATADPLQSGAIPFSNLLSFVSLQRKDADNAAEISESFRVIAGGKDFITPEDIERSLPQNHATECISKMNKYTADSTAPANALDYKSFAENIYGESEV